MAVNDKVPKCGLLRSRQLQQPVFHHLHLLNDCANLLRVGSILRGAELEGADFSAVSLKGVKFRGANLAKAILESAKLTFADLRDATLSEANLMEADLMGAKLCGVNLNKAKLRGASLCGADLSRAILTGTDFSYADLQGSRFEGAKFDQDTNFSDAKVDPDEFRDLDLSALKRENLPAVLWTK